MRDAIVRHTYTRIQARAQIIKTKTKTKIVKHFVIKREIQVASSVIMVKFAKL